MLTRCPRCDTVFRITTEQLRARGGKVRCGHCRAIFNAIESLIEEPSSASARPVPEPLAPSFPIAESKQKPEPEPDVNPNRDPVPPQPIEEATPESAPVPAPAPTPEPILDFEPEYLPSSSPESAPEETTAPVPEPLSETPVALSVPEPLQPEPIAAESDTTAVEETPEETTQAAREAGLVAAREMAETPGYNRWAAGPLADGGLSGLDSDNPRRANWPFAVSAVLLLLLLAVQLAYHFRTDLVRRLPSTGAVFSALGIDVPLPRQPNLVSIEASDLQSDPNRGLLILQATLKNRAPFDQAWPALELTLTDTFDAVVARRVLDAADYLPPKVNSSSFTANSETAIRLWIEAKELAAAGYRLYVFYP